jgi:hypothetical protein
MNKIVLTEKQKKVLEKHLNGKYSPFFSPEEEQLALNEVIDMADTLMHELKAYDDLDGDLMLWFWNKYKEQK